MNTSELVQPRHLNRTAEIYVRQSSPNQVVTNKESQRMQYALRERATSLGWNQHGIHIIDDDLGRSGATTEGREGYQNLVARIALGEVGILLAFDATRLARNCSHWYQLLDLCGLHDCLIADRDGVYDPTSINGRLLLGLKGQISELELHTIRARLTAGLLGKAERGDLELTLPTGLIRTDGVVTKHPNVEVQDRIDLIFSTFMEQRSIAQTVRWFISNDLLLPRRDRHGDINWKRVTAASVSCFLNNPAYAGAAAYGRTRWKKSSNTGKMQEVSLPRNRWRYCVMDKFPAYITWDQYERIQTMLSDNYSEYNRNKTRGVPREGKALLRELSDAKQRLAQTEQDAPSYMIPADLLEMLRDVGPRLPELWNAKLLKTSQQKSLLRSLIGKVVIHRLAPDQIQTRIVWQGGATTSDIVNVTVGKLSSLSGAQEMESTIEKLALSGRSDEEIAAELTLAGHRSPRADKVLESTVRNVRLRKGILRRAHQSHPRRVEGFLTIPQLAEKLEVSRWWISDRINNGTIQINKDEKAKCYLFPDTPEMLADMKSLVSEYQSNLGCGKGHQDE